MLQTLLDVLVQGRRQEQAKRRRCAGRQRVEVGLTGHDLGDDVGRCLSIERRPARQHLVEHAAERPDIGPRVDLFASRLLGRHVRDGPENDPRRRSAGDRRQQRRPAVGGRRGERLGQAKVEDLHRSVRRQLDIGRFQIAVYDSTFVGGGKPFRDLSCDFDRFIPPDRPFFSLSASVSYRRAPLTMHAPAPSGSSP